MIDDRKLMLFDKLAPVPLQLADQICIFGCGVYLPNCIEMKYYFCRLNKYFLHLISVLLYLEIPQKFFFQDFITNYS